MVGSCFSLGCLLFLAVGKAATLNLRPLVNQCLKDYVANISGLRLDHVYLNKLLEFTKGSDDNKHIQPKVKVVLDIGLGSMWHSEVFDHLLQLNISGINFFGRSSSNCEFDSIPQSQVFALREAEAKSSSGYLYTQGFWPVLPLGDTWYKVLTSYPNVKVLMNDVTDEEYFNNQYSASCRIDWQRKIQEHCFVPLLQVHKLNVTSNQHMLDKFTFDQVKVMLSAYRELIKCTVPPENLFQFNLNQMPAVEYWSKLTSFLNIGLPASGVKYLSEGGSVCDSEKQHTDGRHVKRVQCADEYSASISSIYGEKFRVFVRDQLLKTVYTPLRAPEDTDRLVLGIGPGTTGTRTFHFVATQLNVSSLHWRSLHASSANLTRDDFGFDMKVLEKVPVDQRIFWSDTPVPNHWWYLYKAYPNTNFMITDVRNDTAWRENRFIHHCNRSLWISEPSCTAPLPFRYDKTPLAMEFFRLIQIKSMSEDTVHRSFDAYRSLIKCVIPDDKIWWVYVPELTSSEEFWSKFISLLKIKVSSKQRSALIAKGIPHCGSAGCIWGGMKYNVTFGAA